MRKLKIFGIMLLALALVFTLISCGESCTSHTDADKNGKCDNCGADVEVVCDKHTDSDKDGKCDVCDAEVESGNTSLEATDVTLIEDGEIKFRIVTGTGINSTARKYLDKLVEGMKKIGHTVEIVDYTAEKTNSVIEVLVGSFTNRDSEYCLDMHELGPEGYVINNVGNCILILGGTEEGTADALNKFIKDYLGYDDKTKELDDVTVAKKKWKVSPQKNFKIESVTLKGESIKGYNIAVEDIKVYRDSAKTIQDTLYSRAGIWLNIVDLDEAGDKSFVLKSVDVGKAGDKGFKVYVNGTQLVLDCAHDNKLTEAIEAFIGTILYASGELKFGANYLYEYEISKVYYEDFGAKGDGRTDDYQAIRDTHDFANIGGQTVMGKAGATYYIQSTKGKDGKFASITINTNTNWNGAKFIIDDTDVWYGDGGNYSTNIFKITSTLSHSITQEQLDAINANGGITYGTTNIGLTFDYPVMLILRTSDNKVYIRYGGNANDGADQHELILVDKDGNIDPSTPLLFEYPHLSGITVERLDETPITVQNATFESLASKVNLVTEYHSISRGIEISRPNVTVKNLTHIITGEIGKYVVVDKDSNILEGYTSKNDGKEIYDPSGKPVTDGSALGFIGHSFGGFIVVSNTSDVLIEGVTFQARMYYLQGTYDISCGTANNVVFKNCDQSNFFYTNAQGQEIPNTGNPCWGVAGTNYCKNLVYDGSKLARYDAHSGVYNGKIINGSEVSSLRLIGGGDFLIENSIIWFNGGNGVVQLREDYGATFKGHITMRNVQVKSVIGRKPNSLMQGPSANHWFGYTTYCPSLTIDNVSIENAPAEINVMYNTAFNPDAPYPYRGISVETIHKSDAEFIDTNCDKCYLKAADHGNYCTFVDSDGNYACDKCGKRDQDHVETHEFVDANSDTKCDTCKKLETKHAHEFTDGKNLNPYMPPAFIEVINNDANGYQVYINDYSFWENTELKGNIIVKPAE